MMKNQRIRHSLFLFCPTIILYFTFTRSSHYETSRLLSLAAEGYPEIEGQWGPRIPVPLVPAAAVVLPSSGRILMWAADTAGLFDAAGSKYSHTVSALFDPATGSVTGGNISITDHGMFCPGLSLDARGRPIISGGKSPERTTLYDENTESWVSVQNMSIARGYHAQTTLSNGFIFTIGGSWSGGLGGSEVENKDGEVFDPAANAWSSLPGCKVSPMLTRDPTGVFHADNHAWLFSWKNQSVFQAGPSAAMNWYDTQGSGAQRGAGIRAGDHDSMSGNAVMYDALHGKILTLGGSPSYEMSFSTNAAHIITLGDPFNEVIVEEIVPMKSARTFANSVVLPNGEVFINGGVTYAKQWTDVNASMVPELWSPRTQKFTSMARSPIPRSYHSMAILLPDATVLTGGGGICWKKCEDPSANHLDIQVYYPPYLFDSRGSRATRRPEIADISSSEARPGDELTLFTKSEIAEISLVRYGSATHSINTDQRRVQLTPLLVDSEAQRQSRVLRKRFAYQIYLPEDSGIMIPGYWMIFAMDAKGVPSIAKTLHINVVDEPMNKANSLDALISNDQGTDPAPNNDFQEFKERHPRLFATEEEWTSLPEKITADPYLTQWNEAISKRAELWSVEPSVKYTVVGPLSGNGVLDVARDFQLRIKHWAYMYRLTKAEKWKDRVWNELLVGSANSTQYFGIAGDNWNTQHWLDTAEFLVAFSYAYDWLYDAWSAKQREAIMWSIITLGLTKGRDAYRTKAWFLSEKGNWNCVVNGGIIIAALAIYHDDPTGISKELLDLATTNTRENCAQAVDEDGTWRETPDYWYFGTQAQAQLAAALLTATGSTRGLLTANPAFKETGMFHIYSNGMTDKFNYGDCGPSKFTATANSLFFYGDQYDIPTYGLYQRERPDAADPLSMFWYKPPVQRVSYDALPLDRSFNDTRNAWVSMRSSWSSTEGLFVAMKAGELTGHSTHGNLDAGDFVLDAMGERWAMELCHNDYLSTGYFSSEMQTSDRWLYYRTRTAGQNTILYNSSNQIIDGRPEIYFESSSSDVNVGSSARLGDKNTALWITNLTSFYPGPQVQRGLRLLGDRSQVLIQDEINMAEHSSQWRMHTKAKITLENNGRRAVLSINGKYVDLHLQTTWGASFRVMDAGRIPGDSPLPQGGEDVPNPGVQVLCVDIPPGNHAVAVMFAPRWSPDTQLTMPRLLSLSDWAL